MHFHTTVPSQTKEKQQKDTTKYMHCVHNSGKNKTVLISSSLLDQQYPCEEERHSPKSLDSHSAQQKIFVELINLQQTVFIDSCNFLETKFHGYLLQQKPRHFQQSC
jgi:hypothetical protein